MTPARDRLKRSVSANGGGLVGWGGVKVTKN